MRGEHRHRRGDRATPTSQLASRQPLTRGDPGGARRGASCGAPRAGGVHLVGCSIYESVQSLEVLGWLSHRAAVLQSQPNSFARRMRSMNLNLEAEQEEEGRWLAEVLELPGVMAYGASSDEAMVKAEALAFRALAEQLEHAEVSPFPITLSVGPSIDFYRFESLVSLIPALANHSVASYKHRDPGSDQDQCEQANQWRVDGLQVDHPEVAGVQAQQPRGINVVVEDGSVQRAR